MSMLYNILMSREESLEFNGINDPSNEFIKIPSE